jgi:hypothetical protein
MIRETLFGPEEILEEKIEVKPRVDVWTMINSIKNHKNYMFVEDTAKEYVPWIVNKAISSFPEYLHLAESMNFYPGIDPKMQYDFYFHSLPQDRRYKNWEKKQKTKDDKYIESLAMLEDLSLSKAKIAWKILSDKQKKEIIAKFLSPDIKSPIKYK